MASTHRHHASRRLLACVAAGGLALSLSCQGAQSGPGAETPREIEAPPPTATSPIDEALRRAWAARGIEPAPLADDATVLRRLMIDLTGTIPTSDEARAFVADPRPDKLERAVDRLLADPRHARRQARRWERVLMGEETQTPTLDRGALGRWLELAFANNRPWNEVVTELITATGVNSEGGARGVDARLGGIDRAQAERKAGVNGAVNWLIRYARRPEDLAGATSSAFLGMQIQCAQCHDHKTEPWTQEDFRSFTAAFARTRGAPLEPYRTPGEILRVEVFDDERPPRLWRREPDLAVIAALPPRAIDGTPLPEGPERRRALAAWVTSPDNPTFARAAVNRTWRDLMGRGFVEPVDDLRPSNPPLLPDLLDALARDFAQQGFDLRSLTAAIAKSEAYRRSAAGGAARAPADEGALWSRYHVAPMEPEVLLDAVIEATGTQPILERLGQGDAERTRLRLARQLRFVFPDDAESNGPELSATLQQALFLLNGNAVTLGTSVVPGAALGEILAWDTTDDERVRELFWRALSRPPTPEEHDRVMQLIATAGDTADDDERRDKATRRGRGPLGRPGLASRATTERERAFEDVFWGLLNTSEFGLRH